MRMFLGCIAVFLLSACGAEGTYYEKSQETIVLALQEAPLSPMIAGDAADRTVSKPDANTVVITANDAFGGDIFRIVTKLSPEGTGTRVQSRFEMLHKKKGFDEYMAQKMATEHVASAIEGRSPDVMAAGNPMSKAIVNSNPEMKKTINRGLNAAMEMEKMDRQAKFDKKYGDDWGASGDSVHDGWGD